MNQENWQAVVPQYTQYDDIIRQYQTNSNVDFLAMQPRLHQSLNVLCQSNSYKKILTLKSPDNAYYRYQIEQAIKANSDLAVVRSESLNMSELLGSYTCNAKGEIVHQTDGLLKNANNGVLIIPANLLLINPVCWNIIKSVVLGESFNPLCSNPRKPAIHPPIESANVKLVIVGDREQIGDLEYLEPDLYGIYSLYSEIESDLVLNESSIESYLGYISWLCDTNNYPHLTQDAIYRLLIAGARQTEDQSYMPLDPLWLLTLLSEANSFGDGVSISKQNIDEAIDAKYQREGYLPERALADITEGQVIIETEGERVGQVNGLTVIDVSGHPLSYGEPARISCVIHFGDGDISDVERKAELGGNLHAKGMMIMQAFVSSALQLDEPLPYSASVVFEQSYSEVDGDSATLAELCSFVSALSEYPIDQQIAVTGAVDQFGRVQAVGGLNEKIEGFYHVCKHQGLTGKQGVILPKSNLKHLALNNDVVQSIKNGEFHIWSVSTVDEAIPLIMGKSFRGEEESSVISKIAERIESFERHEQPPTFVERIKNWFV